MTLTSKALLLVTGLALAACTNAGRFDENSRNGGMNGDTTGYLAGSPQDPRSPAYFNQTIGDRVLFAVDQSTLSGEAQGILSGQATWLASNPDYMAVIEGHADEQGTREYNIALGARRADAVMQYLISRGVSPSRLKTISYGKERPLALCSDESCYSKNRRAVTVIAAGGFSS